MSGSQLDSAKINSSIQSLKELYSGVFALRSFRVRTTAHEAEEEITKNSTTGTEIIRDKAREIHIRVFWLQNLGTTERKLNRSTKSASEAKHQRVRFLPIGFSCAS